MTKIVAMLNILKRLLGGYGSFFALSHPASKILIFLAAILQPVPGLFGLLGGITVLAARRLLSFSSDSERVEIVNGILLGMLIGSMYAPDYRSVLLVAGGGILIAVTAAIITDTLTRPYHLPLLALPYALVAYILLPVAANLQIPFAQPAYSYWTAWLPPQAFLWLYPLGAMYFNGTTIGGMLVLLGFLLSSRYLALIALASSVLCAAYLQMLLVPTSSLLFMVAQMNGVLSACIIGGLCAYPGKRSLLVSAAAALLACTLALSLSRLFSVVGLPILAVPFVLTTYACMLAFNSRRSKAWTYFWLPVPVLAEHSLEQMQIARARGIDSASVALRAPFDGQWQVYQGFNGSHTHQGVWQYALDFIRTRNGQSFEGAGGLLSDYYAFGEPILAPVYGTVIDCRADLPDNKPGEVDVVNNWGNYILIQLDSGPFVLLAHLQRASLKVQAGSRVAPGELVALCGNSGRSPQPHLHVHVQDTHTIGCRTIPFHLTAVTDIAANAAAFPDGRAPVYSLRACPQERDLVAAPKVTVALRQALPLKVGSRIQFSMERSHGPSTACQLEVKLDLNGQFWLEAASGARVAFTCSHDLLAFYNRTGPEDLLLDALVLSLQLTPFAEGALSWRDVTPRRLLPMNLFARVWHGLVHPLCPCASASFRRSWDDEKKIWLQTAEHRLGRTTWTARATLCEGHGLMRFSLHEGQRELVQARLIGYSVREDNGIPEQRTVIKAVA